SEAIDDYLNGPDISWDNASDQSEWMRLIARQRWLHFNVVQANENWAELRRVDVLGLTFWQDDSNEQRLPPSRWIYPSSEETYNPENYAKVQSIDNLNTHIFWD